MNAKQYNRTHSQGFIDRIDSRVCVAVCLCVILRGRGCVCAPSLTHTSERSGLRSVSTASVTRYVSGLRRGARLLSVSPEGDQPGPPNDQRYDQAKTRAMTSHLLAHVEPNPDLNLVSISSRITKILHLRTNIDFFRYPGRHPRATRFGQNRNSLRLSANLGRREGVGGEKPPKILGGSGENLGSFKRLVTFPTSGTWGNVTFVQNRRYRDNAAKQAAYRARVAVKQRERGEEHVVWETSRAHTRELERENARLQGLVERGQKLHWEIRHVLSRGMRHDAGVYQAALRQIGQALSTYEGWLGATSDEDDDEGMGETGTLEDWTEGSVLASSRTARRFHSQSAGRGEPR
jgi:hypothetical protein